MMYRWLNRWLIISLISEILSNVLDLKCNSLLSVKPDVTFVQGMVFWNITNKKIIMRPH